MADHAQQSDNYTIKQRIIFQRKNNANIPIYSQDVKTRFEIVMKY